VIEVAFAEIVTVLAHGTLRLRPVRPVVRFEVAVVRVTRTREVLRVGDNVVVRDGLVVGGCGDYGSGAGRIASR